MHTCTPRIFVMVLASLCSVMPLVLAASPSEIAPSERLAVTVVYVDPEARMLWFKAPEGALMKLRAPAKLLDDLGAGDLAEVMITAQPDAHLSGVPSHDTVSAVVQLVNVETGLVRLKTSQGDIMNLTPSKAFLDTLKTGENVQIAIYRLQAAQ